jgi:hypothetical protein
MPRLPKYKEWFAASTPAHAESKGTGPPGKRTRARVAGMPQQRAAHFVGWLVGTATADCIPEYLNACRLKWSGVASSEPRAKRAVPAAVACPTQGPDATLAWQLGTTLQLAWQFLRMKTGFRRHSPARAHPMHWSESSRGQGGDAEPSLAAGTRPLPSCDCAAASAGSLLMLCSAGMPRFSSSRLAQQAPGPRRSRSAR